MKRIIKNLMLLAIVSLFAVADSKAQQIVVRIRPARPGYVVVRRPHRPSRRHVWVAEEWTPNGANYAYHAGYWATPPHPGGVWTAGHWRNTYRGYIWIPGHWN
jgi:hypothetical protein